MFIKNYCKSKVLKIFCCVLFCGLAVSLNAQSTEQNSPTPISSNQISGQIKARDIGDARLTTYYYLLSGKRGDIFINVVTKNLNGDIDIFTADGLKPKTKITIYADDSQDETGRVIYMRKAEKMIVRVQGRTPNDDPATFQIKFAGSFEPLEAIASVEDETPKVEDTEENRGTVRVNSVGTIIEDETNEDDIAEGKSVKEKAKEVLEKAIEEDKKESNNPKGETVAKVEDEKNNEESPADKLFIPDRLDPTKKSPKNLKESLGESRPRVIITDTLKDKDSEKKDEESSNLTVEVKEKPKKRSALVTIEKVTEDEKKPEKDKKFKKKKGSLKKINLVIELKSGVIYEMRMDKVSSVNVFDTVLKVVLKDGKVERFSIFDVAKMTMQ